MLKIYNMSFYIDDEPICTNQHFKVHGVCGVLGHYNRLRECFISEFTASIYKKIPFSSANMKIFYKGERINYRSFKCLLNPYTFFNVEDKIEDIFYFVNRSLADEVIKDFCLEDYRKFCIGELSPSVSNICEMAIAVCSNSKILYCYEFLDPFKKTEFYLKLLKKYAVLNDAVIFVEAQFFNRRLFDSFIVFHEDFITFYDKEENFNIGKHSNKLKYNLFVYETYISKFDSCKKSIIEESLSYNSSCLSIESSSSVSNEQYYSLKSLSGLLILKHRFCVGFIRYFKFLRPNFDKTLTLVGLKFNRPSIVKETSVYYTNVGNITMIVFGFKHWFSLHFLFLQLLCWFLLYNLTVIRKSVFNLPLISKYLKFPQKQNFLFSFIDCGLFICIIRYLMYFKAYSFSQFWSLFFKEYIFKFKFPALYDFASSLCYISILYYSIYLLNEDYTFLRRYYGYDFYSSTVYFYFLIYSLISFIFPFLLASLILNVKFIFFVALNCLFTIPLFNIFMLRKTKVLSVVYLITRNNFLYLNYNYDRSFCYRFLRSFDSFYMVKILYERTFDYKLFVWLCMVYFGIFLGFCSFFKMNLFRYYK